MSTPESRTPNQPENNFNQEKRRPEYGKPIEKLKRALAEMSTKINSQVWEKYGLKNLLNSDGSLDHLAYLEQIGGIHKGDKIEQDMKKVKDLEIEFSGANDPDICGNLTPQQIVDIWKKNKQESANSQMEMVGTLLLYKFLKDRFLIVRTNNFDDYIHGVDNLIVDKISGETVGAFDEVHQGGDGEDRIEAKKEKVRKIAKNGGAQIDYGLSTEGGFLKRSTLKNVPVFYLGLHNDELKKLLKDMNYNPGGEITAIEQQTFKLLVASLESQQKELVALKNLKPELKQKLETFATTLKILKQLGQPQKTAEV